MSGNVSRVSWHPLNMNVPIPNRPQKEYLSWELSDVDIRGDYKGTTPGKWSMDVYWDESKNRVPAGGTVVESGGVGGGGSW